MSENSRIEEINHLILEIANGNFDHRLEISDEFNEIDAIVAGINMLSEELKASMIAKSYLKSIFEGIVDMLIIFDEHMMIKDVNHKTLELLCTKEAQLIGQHISFLFPSSEKKVVNIIQASLSHQGFLYNKETRFKLPNGNNIPVSLSLSLLKDNQNENKGIILIAKDLKQVLLTANALKQKNEELNTLVYKVSHDLKGPVASVMGLLELAKMSGDDLSTIKNYLAHIQSSIEKLNQTIIGLLEYSLTSQASNQTSCINVKNLIIDVIQSYSSFPGSEQVLFKLDIAEDLMIVSVKELLLSIFQHLIENAIIFRATYKKQAELKISAERKGNNVVLLFKDNGCGMESQVAAHAFEMFYRGNLACSGSGLGLFITKSNVETLGGEISLNSKIGQGTEFRVLLPSLSGSEINITK